MSKLTDQPPPPSEAAHPPLTLDPRTYDRALACVHCGLCLPACPTYAQTGHEADSPRGRIQLMRGLADGALEATASVRHHLDLCLDCRACETACPSGVVYHELIEETRSRFADQEDQPGGPRPDLGSRAMRWMFFHVFTHPTRFKLALLPARLMQKIGLYALMRKTGLFKLLPLRLQKMEQMLPPKGPLWPRRLPARTPACQNESPAAPPRDGGNKTIAFFTGCIGSVMFDRVNRQAIDLLSIAGADVIAPPPQTCCGAIHHHNGAHHPAQALARRNIDAFLPLAGPAPDFITTTIAGCGAMLREYDVLLRDDSAYAERAREFSRRVRDISEVLVDLKLHERTDLLKHTIRETVTYHDACHLAHAQGVTGPPRLLLAAIPGLRLVPLSESDMCCGAAGTYNLTQPEMAAQLAARKLVCIAATGAEICVTGNAGCALQIQSAAAAKGQRLAVVHPVELLHRAVFEWSTREQS